MRKATSPRIVRCAIYTRKSTDEGLEQDLTASMPSAKLARPIYWASVMRARP